MQVFQIAKGDANSAPLAYMRSVILCAGTKDCAILALLALYLRRIL
jgi:hypothetical protein